MSGITDFDSSIRLGSSADQCGVMRRQRALGENAAGMFEHALERQIYGDQGSKHGMEVRHQHRCSDALAGNVSQHEVQTRVTAIDDVTVVTANDAGRLI